MLMNSLITNQFLSEFDEDWNIVYNKLVGELIVSGYIIEDDFLFKERILQEIIQKDVFIYGNSLEYLIRYLTFKNAKIGNAYAVFYMLCKNVAIANLPLFIKHLAQQKLLTIKSAELKIIVDAFDSPNKLSDFSTQLFFMARVIQIIYNNVWNRYGVLELYKVLALFFLYVAEINIGLKNTDILTLGGFLFKIIKATMKINIQIVENRSGIALGGNYLLGEYAINIKFDSKFLVARKNSFLSCFVFPMYVIPKKWVIKEYFESAGEIFTGGLVLNGVLLKSSLCKSTIVAAHNISIIPKIGALINKVQEIGYTVDCKFVDFLYKHRFHIPGYLNLKEHRALKRDLIALKAKIGFFRKTLEVYKNRMSKDDRLFYIHTLSELYDTRKIIWEDLRHFSQLYRVLKFFFKFKNETSIYFPLQIDWRMRLYPASSVLHPMSNKLARSIVRFNIGFEFSEKVFALMSSQYYCKSILSSENEILSNFYRVIKPILINFRAELVHIFIHADEPLLFLACCFEYERYNVAVLNNQKYFSKMPVYLDVTSSGPQLVSLLFGISEFNKDLNLCAHYSLDDIIGDFYVAVIKDFLRVSFSEAALARRFLSDVVFLKLLRKIFKTNIMAQYYGITYKTFHNDAMVGLTKNFALLSIYFNFSAVSFDKIISSFWKFLQKNRLNFQLKFYLGAVSKCMSGSFSWSVFDVNKITMCYPGAFINRYSNRNKLLGRNFYSFTDFDFSKFSRKQRRGLMANFIHSLDAYVMFRVIEDFNKPLLCIHDCWGVPINSVDEIINIVKNVYFDMFNNKRAFNYFNIQFKDKIQKLSGDCSVREFEDFVKLRIKFDISDYSFILNSKYLVFFS